MSDQGGKHVNEKLSDGPNERLLIVNADDLGITQSTNRAICELFQKGAITSASIMMPCESAREAADLCVRNGITDIGVHFTLTGNAYMPVYRERRLHSLTDANGYFHQDTELLEKNADTEEVWLELEAQLQAVISSGIQPTHADSHAGSLFGLFAGRDFLEIALELCGKYGVPFNLPLKIVEEPSFSDSQ
ncbi:hypothetical protein DQG23_16245 [Paenibacillus contaminans]|uniref:ChbG/HpnK family deacetylase n=1 Tax=Paenibacillus contaminans TaxID=450362 RepID=A0A329MRD6_9BACL|nr:hypothetical protein DQG23_16245 [Paenibacillus contaminans]